MRTPSLIRRYVRSRGCKFKVSVSVDTSILPLQRQLHRDGATVREVRGYTQARTCRVERARDRIPYGDGRAPPHIPHVPCGVIDTRVAKAASRTIDVRLEGSVQTPTSRALTSHAKCTGRCWSAQGNQLNTHPTTTSNRSSLEWRIFSACLRPSRTVSAAVRVLQQY